MNSVDLGDLFAPLFGLGKVDRRDNCDLRESDKRRPSCNVEPFRRSGVVVEPGRPEGPLGIGEVTAQSVRLSWRPPSDDGGGEITGYVVEAKDCLEVDIRKSHWRVEGQSTDFTVRGLQTTHIYQFRVYAENAAGRSEALLNKQLVRIKAASKKPPPPPQPSARPLEDGVLLEWAAPAAEGLEYLVERFEPRADLWLRCNRGALRETCWRADGLRPGRPHRFRVSSENAFGVSRPSPELAVALAGGALAEEGGHAAPAARAAPSIAVPAADCLAEAGGVAAFSCEFRGSPPLQVTWLRDGVRVREGCVRTTGDSRSTVTLTDVDEDDDDAAVECVVRNAAGRASSGARLRVASAPKIGCPSSYRDGLACDAGDDLRLRVTLTGWPLPEVTWSVDGAPAADGGRVRVAGDGRTSAMDVLGLRKEDAGLYGASAASAAGRDDLFVRVTVAGAPDPVSEVRVTDSTTDGVRLCWAPPTNDGGSPIFSYIVEKCQAGSDEWIPSIKTRATNGSVENCKGCLLRVRALNAFGMSEPSHILQFNTSGQQQVLPSSGHFPNRIGVCPADEINPMVLIPEQPVEVGKNLNVSPSSDNRVHSKTEQEETGRFDQAGHRGAEDVPEKLNNDTEDDAGSVSFVQRETYLVEPAFLANKSVLLEVEFDHKKLENPTNVTVTARRISISDILYHHSNNEVEYFFENILSENVECSQSSVIDQYVVQSIDFLNYITVAENVISEDIFEVLVNENSLQCYSNVSLFLEHHAIRVLHNYVSITNELCDGNVKHYLTEFFYMNCNPSLIPLNSFNALNLSVSGEYSVACDIPKLLAEGFTPLTKCELTTLNGDPVTEYHSVEVNCDSRETILVEEPVIFDTLKKLGTCVYPLAIPLESISSVCSGSAFQNLYHMRSALISSCKPAMSVVPYNRYIPVQRDQNSACSTSFRNDGMYGLETNQAKTLLLSSNWNNGTEGSCCDSSSNIDKNYYETECYTDEIYENHASERLYTLDSRVTEDCSDIKLIDFQAVPSWLQQVSSDYAMCSTHEEKIPEDVPKRRFSHENLKTKSVQELLDLAEEVESSFKQKTEEIECLENILQQELSSLEEDMQIVCSIRETLCNASGDYHPMLQNPPSDYIKVEQLENADRDLIDFSEDFEPTCAFSGASTEYAPQVVSHAQNRIVPCGCRTRFYCSISGNPEPDIVWLKNGKILPVKSRYMSSNLREFGQCLDIFNAKSTDSGEYTCLASNTYGTAMTQAYLQVRGNHEYSPVEPVFLRSQEDIDVSQGETVLLEWKVTGMPFPRVTWFKNAEKMETSLKVDALNTHRGLCRLVLYDVTADDSAIYTCFIENEAGSALSTVLVSVLERRTADPRRAAAAT